MRCEKSLGIQYGVAKFTKARWEIPPSRDIISNDALKNNGFFKLARSLHCKGRAQWRVQQKGKKTMFVSIDANRNMLISAIAALMSAAVFVSAAISPLPFA